MSIALRLLNNSLETRYVLNCHVTFWRVFWGSYMQKHAQVASRRSTYWLHCLNLTWLQCWYTCITLKVKLTVGVAGKTRSSTAARRLLQTLVVDVVMWQAVTSTRLSWQLPAAASVVDVQLTDRALDDRKTADLMTHVLVDALCTSWSTLDVVDDFALSANQRTKRRAHTCARIWNKLKQLQNNSFSEMVLI